jgi:hypothetical protein
MTTIALAIPFCPWIPERLESMYRLLRALDIQVATTSACDGFVLNEAEQDGRIRAKYFGDKLPNDQWSERVFEWLASANADFAMQIQEDAEVSPNFWAIVRAILEALPPVADIVGLHVVHPETQALAANDIRLFTTADALVGVCWAMRGATMREFVEWRRTQLEDGWRNPVPPKGLPGITEDTMIALFAMATGRKIYHPTIAPVDHDTSMASVWGNDDHENRRPRVSWKHADETGLKMLADPYFWRGGKSIPHLGRFYDATLMLARRWVKGFSDAHFLRARADTGASVLRTLRHATLARAPVPHIASVMICMPQRGAVSPFTMQTVWQVLRDEGLYASCAHDTFGINLASENLVRGRSRMLREAYESGVDFAFFLDSDVSCEPRVLRGLIVAATDGNKPIVHCPYPRRDADSVRYRIDFDPTVAPDEFGCVPMRGSGLGCTLISRRAMRVMFEHYAYDPALAFDDVIEGTPIKIPTVALFQLMVRDRVLHGEDSSFYLRAIDAGLQPWLYLGPGAPAKHHGEYVYAGDVRAFLAGMKASQRSTESNTGPVTRQPKSPRWGQNSCRGREAQGTFENAPAPSQDSAPIRI